MVNILRHAAGAPVIDAQAMRQFNEQWQAYRKLVDQDYLWHQEVRSILHRFLTKEVARPFRFLDLACGDASTMVPTLKGTLVSHYHGIDLSGPALELARNVVGELPCAAELEQRDFVAAMKERPEPADVVWIGLSLHHLQTADKRDLMRAIHAALDPNGWFLLYEPALREGESRAAFLDRFEDVARAGWTALTKEEWQSILNHVRTSDFPESPSVWAQLAREAGFSSARTLFADPNQLFGMYCFRR